MQNGLAKKVKDSKWFPFGAEREYTLVLPAEAVKLWQLDHNYHCSIIGTCLTMAEVKKILKQLRVGMHGYSAYELHSTIVAIIADNAFPSKKVQTYLDKKFKAVVQNIRKMTAPEIMGFWKAALYSGDMIGAFWAVMMHPNSDAQMQKSFYGDIHMLSHMSGASNRADLKRLSQLEEGRKGFKAALQAQNLKYNKLALDNNNLRNSEKSGVEERVGLENEVYALKNSLEQLMVLQSIQERQELDVQVNKLHHKVNCQISEAAKLQSNIKQLSGVIGRQKQQINADKKGRLEHQNEIEYLQTRIERSLQSSCPLQKQGLCGQYVLYVGGKTNLVPFYRNLVEERAGVFMHHDGGIEKNTQDLQQYLSKADVVIFPSGCISHDAYWKIKSTCKKQHKPYRHLKSSGLYSLSSMLELMTIKVAALEV